VIGQQRDPKPLGDAGRERVGAGQDQIECRRGRVFHRLQLARKLRSGRLIEGEAGDGLRLRFGISLDRLLREGEVARDVDDVDVDRCRRHRKLGRPRRATENETPAAPAVPPTKSRRVIL